MAVSSIESLVERGVQGVLFDNDGTLVDSRDLLLASFRFATEQVLGRTFSDTEFMAGVGTPLDLQMYDFTDDSALAVELARVYREHNAAVHDDLIRSFPGMTEVLERFRAAGIALGVVTSKRHEVAARGLRRCGLDGFFEVLIGPDDWPEHKPAPGPVLHACDLMGLDPHTCAYVGDSPFDIRAGNAAGTASVAVLWGMFPHDELVREGPAAVCERIDALPGLFGVR